MTRDRPPERTFPCVRSSPGTSSILVLVVVLLFGGKRLPDAARGLGRSLRIFKSEVKQMQDDEPAARGQAAAPSRSRAGSSRSTGSSRSSAATTPGETPRRDV